MSTALTRRALFFGFLKIGLTGFGGVAAVARHVIVEERRWLDDREYAVLIGLGQVLPGANVTNLAFMLGARHHGIPGALIAVGGLLAMPVVIAVGLVAAYGHWSHVPHVHAIVASMGSVAAGLVVGTGIKMLIKVRLNWAGLALAAAAVVGLAGLRLPLIWVLAALVPTGVLVALWQSRGRP